VATFIYLEQLRATMVPTAAALPTRRASEPASSIAIEIYLIGMNLSLAATMLL
jgi:hypothetical protein